MSASKNPNSSLIQERNDKTPTLKLSLKGQPKSLPNLFESMNINEEGKKHKPYSQKNAVVRSRVKSFEGKKVAWKLFTDRSNYISIVCLPRNVECRPRAF